MSTNSDSDVSVRLNYANKIGWTDVEPYEVICHDNEKRLTIRSMDAQLDPTWKPEIEPGGFSGHCTNNHSQRWIITPNENGRQLKIRLHKDGNWYDKYHNRYKLYDEPVMFHDYNF